MEASSSPPLYRPPGRDSRSPSGRPCQKASSSSLGLGMRLAEADLSPGRPPFAAPPAAPGPAAAGRLCQGCLASLDPGPLLVAGSSFCCGPSPSQGQYQPRAGGGPASRCMGGGGFGCSGFPLRVMSPHGPAAAGPAAGDVSVAGGPRGERAGPGRPTFSARAVASSRVGSARTRASAQLLLNHIKVLWVTTATLVTPNKLPARPGKRTVIVRVYRLLLKVDGCMELLN